MDVQSFMKGGYFMLPALTDREIEILKLVARGLTNREISQYLSISESTVENHIHNIYTKLGISNRAQATVFAIHLKIILPNDLMENRGNPP
jgi:DNA-binding NarL/FixJ family response regulator